MVDINFCYPTVNVHRIVAVLKPA